MPMPSDRVMTLLRSIGTTFWWLEAADVRPPKVYSAGPKQAGIAMRVSLFDLRILEPYAEDELEKGDVDDDEEEEKGDVGGDDIIDEEPKGEPRWYRDDSLGSRQPSFTCRPISDWLQLLKHSRSWRSRFDENDDEVDENEENGREEWAGGEAASCRMRIGIRSGRGRDDEMADFMQGPLESS